MKDILEKKIKRGKEAWSFFYTIFAIFVAVIVFVIGILPINDWIYKILVFGIFLLILIWVCLISTWWQNKFIGLRIKLEETWRKI